MKTKQTTHTPTPWSTTGFSIRSPLIKREVMAVSLSSKTSEPYFEEITSSVAQCKTREDAAFIVRAVNSHEDMLLALEEVKAYLVKTGRQDARSYVEQIAVAIAKAEGK